jgi:hypothetical protein
MPPDVAGSVEALALGAEVGADLVVDPAVSLFRGSLGAEAALSCGGAAGHARTPEPMTGWVDQSSAGSSLR